MIRQRLLKISCFFLVIIIILSACNNPTTVKESNSVTDETLSLPIVTTNLTEYIVAITGVNNDTRLTANKQLFSLGDNRFLTVLETEIGYSYHVFDLRIPSIRLSNKLDLDNFSKDKPVEIDWLQISDTKFLIKNPNDRLEVYVWEIDDTPDKLYGEKTYRLPLQDTFVDYAINDSTNTFIEIVDSGNQIQTYKLSLGDNTELNLQGTLTKEQLKLPADSELKQLAFLNNSEFVYTWNIKDQISVGGYGIYSLEYKAVTLLKDNDANELIVGNDAIIIAKEDKFTYIHESGLSKVITQQDLTFTIEDLQKAHVSNGYIVFSYKGEQYWACINPFQKDLAFYFKMDLEKKYPDVDFSNASTTIAIPYSNNVDGYTRWNVKPEIIYLAPSGAPYNESKMLSLYRTSESQVLVRNMKFEVMPPEEFDKLFSFASDFSQNITQNISTIGEFVDALFEFNIVTSVEITNQNSNETVSINRAQKNVLTLDQRDTKLVPDTDYKILYNYNPSYNSDSEININR